MKTEIVKWGNSLAVRISKPVAQQAKLKQGDTVEIEAAADGRIELHRITRFPTLAELVSQITPENRNGEVTVRKEIGKEIVEW